MRRLTVLLLVTLCQILVVGQAHAQAGRASGQVHADPEAARYAIASPEPAWWAQGRRGMHGKVTCQMIINQKTGEVDEVKVLRHSRFSELDAACVLAAFKWKFRPGTIKSATHTFELVLTGYYKEIH